MRTSVTLDDDVFEELVEITGETNGTRAVRTAVEHFLRGARLERLRSFKGRVATLDNDEIDQPWSRSCRRRLRYKTRPGLR